MATSIEQLNTVQHYLADIAHVPSLSHEKESLLLQRICTARQCGDPHLEAQARCGLIEGYLHHVISIAKQHQYLFHSLSLPDLIQEGNIGLLQAVKDYDFTQTSGCFFADATACIRNAIIRALPKDCLIRVSRSDYWRMAEQGTLMTSIDASRSVWMPLMMRSMASMISFRHPLWLPLLL